MTFPDINEPPSDSGYRCPCCRFLTLRERGGFEMCPVCYWEDDGQDEHDARRNFKDCGASDPAYRAHVRPPRDEER
ncbi:CPCC family cysteine-rich protein [Bradyrhizobium sp. SZCCHNS3002]|uniref:CPCC family cysteine-rich protein n=1 Tax=Bradyrhizobium sp. SZCCHNS3002 TaxID=3057310 RepID=UPI003965848E